MNKAYLLVLLLLVVPLAHATLDIDRVRVEINDESEENDAGNGDEFNLERNDKIELTVYFENKFNYPVDVRLDSEIEWIKDDGDDLEDETQYKEIEAGDNSRQTISYTIPSNAEYDEFDLNLRVKYRNSSTDNALGQWNYSFIIDVREKEEEVIPEASLNDALNNLTSSCNAIAQTTTTCFGYIEDYDTCSSDLSTVAEERGTYKQKSEDCESTLGTVREDVAQCNRDKTGLDNQIKDMKTISQCTADTAAAVSEAKNEAASQNSKTMMTIGAAAFAWWFYQNKKKQKSSVDKAYATDYYDKG